VKRFGRLFCPTLYIGYHGDRDPLITASADAVQYNDLSRIQSVFWLPVEGLGKIFLSSVWLPAAMRIQEVVSFLKVWKFALQLYVTGKY